MTDEAAKVNSSDLNEELGQIEILFSDKTGTLTENIMLFKEASINGIKYDSKALRTKNKFSSFTNESSDDKEYEDLDNNNDVLNEIYISDFLTVLGVCHTVQVASDQSDGGDNKGYLPDNNFEHLQYNAASPDEKALIEACASFGVKFIGDEETEDSVKTRLSESRSDQVAVIKEYKKLFVLEFDSTRKRMSVIVEYPSGVVMLVTKGAESSVLPRCVSGPVNSTNTHIDQWALLGLREIGPAST